MLPLLCYGKPQGHATQATFYQGRLKMKDEYLPGLESLKHTLTEKEEKCKFYEILFVKMNSAERLEIFWPHESGYERDDKKELTQISGYAEKYGLELPTSIKRELKQWKGEEKYMVLRKAKGYKSHVDLEDRIQLQIPLSLKGFKKTKGETLSFFTKRIGNKEITIWIPTMIDEKLPTRDIAKRAFKGICMFASQRNTPAPGPITLGELLDRIGEFNCRKEQRLRIMEFCDSFSKSGIQIKRFDKLGEKDCWDTTPFFSRFIWNGKLDLDVQIWPIFNMEVYNMLADWNLRQYLWNPVERLKRLKGLDDRDRLLQDNFRLLQNLPCMKIRIKKLLIEKAQFTEMQLLKMNLESIKKFVNKNLNFAVTDGTLKGFDVQRFQKKSEYLNQIITLHPVKVECGRFDKPLTSEQATKIKELATKLYEIGLEDYATIREETLLGYLENMARADRLDCAEQALEEIEDYEDPDYPVDEQGDYKSRPMKFWPLYNSLVEAKEKKNEVSK